MAEQIPQELIDRINQLSHKKKTVGLTEDEQVEQKSLREIYLALFRQNFRNNLEMVRVFNKAGKEVTPAKVRKIQKEKGLRND